jgi:hypothetical protein
MPLLLLTLAGAIYLVQAIRDKQRRKAMALRRQQLDAYDAAREKERDALVDWYMSGKNGPKPEMCAHLSISGDDRGNIAIGYNTIGSRDPVTGLHRLDISA